MFDCSVKTRVHNSASIDNSNTNDAQRVRTERVADQLDMGVNLCAGLRLGPAPLRQRVIVAVPQGLQQQLRACFLHKKRKKKKIQ